MIGVLLGILGALRSRSTWSRRSQVENHQEQLAGVREAMEILVGIKSTGGAWAAPDGPSRPNPCASSARGVRGRDRSHARPFGLPCSLCRSYAHMGLLGREWGSGMRILLVNAVRDPCPGSVWTRQPIGMCWRACMRV